MIHFLIDTENINAFESLYILRNFIGLNRFSYDDIQLKPFFNEKHMSYKKSDSYIGDLMSYYGSTEVMPFYLWDTSHNAMDNEIKTEVDNILSYDFDCSIYIISNDNDFYTFLSEYYSYYEDVEFKLLSKVIHNSNLNEYFQEDPDYDIYSNGIHSYFDVYSNLTDYDYSICFLSESIPSFNSNEHKYNYAMYLVNKFIKLNIKGLGLKSSAFRDLKDHLKNIYTDATYGINKSRHHIISRNLSLMTHKRFIKKLERKLKFVSRHDFPYALLLREEDVI